MEFLFFYAVQKSSKKMRMYNEVTIIQNGEKHHYVLVNIFPKFPSGLIKYPSIYIKPIYLNEADPILSPHTQYTSTHVEEGRTLAHSPW